MLEEYDHLKKFSFREMFQIISLLNFKPLIIGGWAVHFHVDKEYMSIKGREYIGSKDIDIGIHEVKHYLNLKKVLKKLGFKPISFRYYKVLDYDTGLPTSEDRPLYDLFYLYVDIIFSSKNRFKNIREEHFIIEEPLIREIYAEKKYVSMNKYCIPYPEYLFIMKLKAVKYRSGERYIKDLLDMIMLYTFTSINFDIIQEFVLRERLEENVRFTMSRIKDILNELVYLRFDRREAKSIILSLRIVLKKLL